MTDEEQISPSPNTSQIERLRAIMHRLRAPGGCPWDAEQDHNSLLPNLLEETYELVDTIQRGDIEHMKEELGDVLLQVIFHSELAEEAGHFSFDDVACTVSDKLVRRHPHVYAGADAKDSHGVLNQWERIKREEKGDQDEVYLHRVAEGLPGLLRAAKIQKKVAKVGFDWPDDQGVIEKIKEETAEVEAELSSGDQERLTEEIGDLLFSVVNLARRHKIDPELALTETTERFRRRFSLMEAFLANKGTRLAEASLEDMEFEWQNAKA